MNEVDVVRSLAALAQANRLRVFRTLVVAGPEGLTPTAMGEALGVAPATLSFHLRELTHAALVTQERQGRNLVYRAAFDRMNGVMTYLTDHCCQGRGCEAISSSARAEAPTPLEPIPHPRP